MAYAWARKGETPRKVAYHFTQDQDAISLRVALPTDPEDRVFDTTQLGDLWLTLQGSGFNLKNSNVALYTDKLDDEGKAIRLVPGVQVEVNGKTKEYAYTEKQLKAFGVPKNIHLMSNNFGGPLLIVGQLPYVRAARGGSRRETPNVTRMTAAPTAEPTVKRAKSA